VRAGCALPVLAIGGIDAENACMVPRFSGIAVSSAVCAALEPKNICLLLHQSRV
jgi:thiamine monophosphate synthase